MLETETGELSGSRDVSCECPELRMSVSMGDFWENRKLLGAPGIATRSKKLLVTMTSGDGSVGRFHAMSTSTSSMCHEWPLSRGGHLQ